MVKLNLNQTIRIVIPGAFFGLLISFTKLFRNLSQEINVSNFQQGFIGILFAFLAGLVLDIFFQKFHYWFFRWVLSRKKYGEQDYYLAWKRDFMEKAKSYNIQINFPNYNKLSELIDFVDATFFSRRFNNDELSYFRYPKSLGIMCFNLALISVIIFLIVLFFEYTNIFFIESCAIMTILFLIASYKYFVKSNQRELVYWRGCSEDDLVEVLDIFKLWEIRNALDEKFK